MQNKIKEFILEKIERKPDFLEIKKWHKLKFDCL